MKDFSYERHGSDLINSRLCVIENRAQKNRSISNLKKLHSCIDLTSLSNADNENSIADFVMSVNTFKEKIRAYQMLQVYAYIPSLYLWYEKFLPFPKLKLFRWQELSPMHKHLKR